MTERMHGVGKIKVSTVSLIENRGLKAGSLNGSSVYHSMESHLV